MLRLLPGLYDSPGLKAPVSSATIARGAAVMSDLTNSVVIPATSSTTVKNLFGVVHGKAVTAADTVAEVMPIVPNASQLWEIDCTDAVAADQLHKYHALTDSLTLNNTSTTVDGVTGVFKALALGSTATKLIGHFVPYNIA